MPAASIRMDQHGEPQLLIATWLGVYVALTPGVQGGGSATSQLDDDNEPEGDAVLRIRPEFGGQSQTDKNGYIVGAPELIVEIAASTTQRDLELKLEIYRRNGVREYLVWETLGEEFYWFELENGEYIRRFPDENHVIQSRVFPGLWLDVEVLLNGNLARVLQIVQQGTATAEHAAFVELLESRRTKT
jgi:Uma2 family endonuclease